MQFLDGLVRVCVCLCLGTLVRQSTRNKREEDIKYCVCVCVPVERLFASGTWPLSSGEIWQDGSDTRQIIRIASLGCAHNKTSSLWFDLFPDHPDHNHGARARALETVLPSSMPWRLRSFRCEIVRVIGAICFNDLGQFGDGRERHSARRHLPNLSDSARSRKIDRSTDRPAGKARSSLMNPTPRARATGFVV